MGSSKGMIKLTMIKLFNFFKIARQKCLKNVKMPRIKLKQLIFNIAIFILIVLAFIYRERLYLEYYTFFNYIDDDTIFKSSRRNFTKTNHVFKSVCNCRKEIIYLDKTDNAYQVSFINIGHHDSNISQSKEKIFQYEVPIDTFESATFLCDMYHVLRRGPNSKVLSYSLYGKNRFYYDLIFSLADLVKKYYPDWTVRIHYDETIDKSIICEIECLKQKNNMNLFYDNVDFCNIEKLPYDTSKTWNARFVHICLFFWQINKAHFTENHFILLFIFFYKDICMV